MNEPILKSLERDPFHYTMDKAWVLAWLSALAYYPDAALAQKQARESGADAFEFCAANDTEAHVVGCGDVLVVSFRGTEPTHLKEWIQDADRAMVPGPFGYGDHVHQGFAGCLSDIWSIVCGAILRNARPYVMVTGHSRGGALAQLAAACVDRLERVHRLRLAGVCTFASPRVGNSGFCQLMDDLPAWIVHHQNRNDFIPRLPLLGFEWRPWKPGFWRWPPRLYSRSGHVHYHAMDGALVWDPSWWWQTWDRYQGIRGGLLHWATDGALDHRMGRYLADLVLAANATDNSRGTL